MAKRRVFTVIFLAIFFALACALSIAACKINADGGNSDDGGNDANTHEHVLVELALPENLKSDVTCTRGAIYYKTCSVCGEKSTETFEVGEGTGHTPETLPAIPATCIRKGYTEGARCTVCGKTVIVQAEIPLIPHDYHRGICAVCNAEAPESEGVLYELSSDNKYYIVAGKGTCTDKDIIIPATHNRLPVKEIKQSAFEYATGIDSVVLLGKNNVSIGNLAFRGSSIKSAYLPAGVTTLGDRAFYGCEQLESVEFGENFKVRIPNNAFEGCKALTEIVIPQGVTQVGDEAFKDCGLTKVTLPASLTDIGMAAFAFNPALEKFSVAQGNSVYSQLDGNLVKNVVGGKELVQYAAGREETEYAVPTEITEIAGFAFSGSLLNGVTISVGVKTIKYSAFKDCVNLTEIEIPDSVTYIGLDAFRGCAALTKVSLGNGALYVNADAFRDTPVEYKEYENGLYLGNASNPYHALVKAKDTEITSCTLHTDTKIIMESAFKNCAQLTELVVPDGLKAVGNNALYNCPESILTVNGNGYYLGNETNPCVVYYLFISRVEPIQIDPNTKVIAASAFSSNSGATIVVPNGVTHICDGAFEKCGEAVITIPSSVVYLGEKAFANSPQITINYQGTVAEWNGVSKGFNCFDAGVVIHCNDGDVTV